MFKVVANKTLTIFLVVLICLSPACTTMRPIAVDGNGDQIRNEIRVGDTIRVVTKNNAIQTIRVTTVGASSVIGSADSPATPIEIPYQDIKDIEVRQGSGAKTTWLMVGAVVLGLAIWVGSASGWGQHTVGFNR